jgi:hypothetical protein
VRQIAERLGLLDKATDKRKATLVALLVKEIPRRAAARQEVAALSKAERGALALVLQQGGSATVSDLMMPLVLGGMVRMDGSNARRTFSPLRDLAIPPEVVRVLPRKLLQPPQANFKRHAIAPPARVVSRSAEDAMRRLFFVWAELQRQPGKELQAGGLYKRDLRRLAQSMGLELAAEEATLCRSINLLLAMRLLDLRHHAKR